MKVVIADDSALLREGLVRLLAELDIETVAQAVDVDELLSAVEEHAPDVAIVDIRMPPTFSDEGIVAAGLLRARWPRVGILLLSQHVDLRAAMALGEGGAGGVGYLLKERVADAMQLAEALARVATGDTVFDPEVVRRLLLQGRSLPSPLDALSNRERAVLSLMAEGRSNGAIARRLVVNERTVESHVAAIFARLHLPIGEDDNRRVLAVRSWLTRELRQPDGSADP